MGMLEVALAPDRMGCGNVGGGGQDGVWECWTPDRMGCGNVGGGT